MFKIILDRIVQQFKNLLQQQTHVSDRENDIGVAVDNAKTLSSYGTQLISSFEGLALIAYQCPANVWTIGSGTTQVVNLYNKAIHAHWNRLWLIRPTI